jgi:hypothetical protein
MKQVKSWTFDSGVFEFGTAHEDSHLKSALFIRFLLSFSTAMPCNSPSTHSCFLLLLHLLLTPFPRCMQHSAKQTHQICLATFPTTPGLSLSHSSLSEAYTKSVSKISKAKFHTSVIA